MKTIIKPLFILAIMALSVFSYAQELHESQKSTTYVENEFIIWLEQGVDAMTFAARCDVAIVPKRLLSKRPVSYQKSKNHYLRLKKTKIRDRINAWHCGGVVTQRSAKPRTPVQFR